MFIGQNQNGNFNCKTFATESSTSEKTLLMLHYVLCSMYYALCTIYYVLCTLCIAQCTMYYATDFSTVFRQQSRSAAECTVDQHFNKTIGDEGITVDFRFIKVHTSN